METKIVIINELNKEETIKSAGNIIKNGGLVAFPTETVYGLGANALSKEAVQKIFRAKGRPQDNPLIIHVASQDITPYVKEVPPLANELMDAFWPGPLTMIFKKADIIPLETSGGLDTVGVRMPNNELALSLIKESNVPIAAPSANRSGRPSPTEIEHCIIDLDNRVNMIIGGETSTVGLESTIIDLTSTPPCILRPGGISLEELQVFDSSIYIDPHIMVKSENIKAKAPGMKYRHYAPNALMYLVEGENTQQLINQLTKQYQSEHKRVGVLATDESKDNYQADIIHSLGSRNDLTTIAHHLYDALRLMDKHQVDIILSETFDEKGLGIAIMNRLKKAASFEIIKDIDNNLE